MTRTVLSLWKGQILVRGVETMASILDDVSASYGVSVADLKGPSRRKAIVGPRQEAMWRMVETGKWSFPQIARVFNRDHTTVLHGWRQVSKRRENLTGTSQIICGADISPRADRLQITA